MDLVRSMEWIAKLVQREARLLNVEIGDALTQQLRRRLVRVARTFLLKSAELAERRRAADPVRKCAACAVEAVKSQLALGIERGDAKRQRV
jgi:aminoglycoside phosphotransferase family enzyme